MLDWATGKILDYLSTLSDIYIRIIVFYAILMCIIGMIITRYIDWKTYWKINRWKTGIVFSLLIPLIVILIGYSWLENSNCSPKFIYFVLCIAFFIFIMILVWLSNVKSYERRKMDNSYENESNPIIKFEKLSNINCKKLLPDEVILWKDRMAIVYYELGNLRGMENLIDTENADNSRSMMMKAILAEYKGDLKSSQDLMLSASNKPNIQKQDHYLWIQLLVNIGRSYRIAGNINEAMVFYTKAKNELKMPKEKGLANTVFSGYIFNLCLLKNSWNDVEQALKEYTNLVDMDLIENKVTYYNFSIEAAKQIGEEEHWKKMISDGFEEIMNLHMKAEIRLSFEISSLRLANYSRVNFIPILEAIRKDKDYFMKLPMPSKYLTLKEIHIFFGPKSDVNPFTQNKYKELFQIADNYICNQAISDIKNYKSSLPIEAVNERAVMDLEIAGIMRYQDDYCFDECKEILLSVRGIYESNYNLIEAAKVSVILADEHFAPQNLDYNFQPKKMESLKNALEYAEKIIKNLWLHPGIADVYCKLATIHIRIHDYKASLPFAEKFRKMNLSIEHFAPCLNVQIVLINLVAKILQKEKTLQEIKKHPEQMIEISTPAKKLIENYPKIDPLDMCYLWATLLNLDEFVLKTVMWKEVQKYSNAEDIIQPIKHSWIGILYEKVVLFELDIAYTEFESIPDSRIVFVPNTHPIQTGRSQRILKIQQQNIFYKEQLKKKNPNDKSSNVYLEIKKLIDSYN